MKKRLWIGLTVIACLTIVVGVWQFPAISQSTLTLEGFLANVYSGTGTEALNVAWTQSTVGLDVSEESALTNTVHEVMSLTHTTSGTPANGIGLEWAATQETSASNNEDIGSVGFYMSDVTAASEDASFSVELMAGGSAKSEVFVVNSVGDGALDGSLSFGGFKTAPYEEITAATYSITAATKAQYFVVNYTDTGAVGLTLDTDLTVDGRILTIKDGELNANTNNIVIGTEGAGTIDEAATYTMDADGESVTLLSDGTDWFIMNAYGE